MVWMVWMVKGTYALGASLFELNLSTRIALVYQTAYFVSDSRIIWKINE